MPDTTSLGIVYPCSGEQISLAALQNYATTTQAALAATDVIVNAALNPPYALVRRAVTAQLVPAGATTTVSFDVEVVDTAGEFTLASPTQLVVPSNGSYLASVQVQMVGQPTTLTSYRGAILINGAEVAYRKSDQKASAFGPTALFFIASFVPALVAGDIYTTTQLFTGTGNLSANSMMSLTKVSNV